MSAGPRASSSDWPNSSTEGPTEAGPGKVSPPRYRGKVSDVFMGLYPLPPRNVCHFEVADFDGATAMLDAPNVWM